jgi:co-chaperonin GroES (HSP10)
MENCPGARATNRTLTMVPHNAEVKPLRDRIVIEPLDWKPSQYLEVVYTGETLRGRVKAIGPGRHPIKYDGPKGKRTKAWEAKQFIPTEVKVGDIVELGGLEIRGYLFTSFLWGDKEHIICQEADVAGVVDTVQ